MKDLKEKWEFYKDWLYAKLPQYAEFNDGATEEQVTKLKSHFSFDFPDELYILYKLNNGDKSSYGAFMGLKFLSMDSLVEEYDLWNRIPPEENLNLSKYCSSNPVGVVKRKYVNPFWIPVFIDFAGNCIGIDLDPDVNGIRGQIINFGRDEMDKVQISINLEGLLDIVLKEISNGNCENAIILEDDGGYSYGLRPQSHLIDDLKKIIGTGAKMQ